MSISLTLDSGNFNFKKVIINRIKAVKAIGKIVFMVLLFFGMQSSISAQISGTVFRDYNGNGIKETGEPLVSGILVKSYNASNTLCSSTSSSGATSPNFTLPNTCTGPVRVEFEIPVTNPNLDGAIAGVDYVTGGGGTYGSSVQFVNSGTASLNFGVNYPSDFCQTSPNVLVAQYINGDPVPGGAGMSGSYPGLFKFPYGIANQSATPPTQVATAGELGAVWGASYQRSSKKLFTAAFLKRHVGLSNAGLGGIFTTDFTPATPTSSLYIDLENLGVNLGQSVLGARSLPSSPTSSSNDAPAFDLVAKIGLGGMSMSDDGDLLYTINLFERKLIRINVGSPAKPGASVTAADITQFVLPNPGCTGGVARPFAVKYYRGKVYVGMVCSSESGGTQNNLYAYVYEFNPVTNTFNGTPLISFPLNYPKGKVHTAETPAKWNPWVNNFAALYFGSILSAGQRTMLPQPVLSDIDFVDGGDIVLSFFDRAGHQLGYKNRGTTGTAATFNGYIGGDILRLRNISGTWTIENNAKVGSGGNTQTGCGASTNQGPGNGEFFCDEKYLSTHEETSQGSSFTIPGKNEIITTVMDPINVWSGGTSWFSTADGNDSKRYQLYNTVSDNGVTFGKANGLGTLELACDPQPIEIGNRVWLDTNNNGIQDAGESPLQNVTVELRKADNTLIATAVTDANGNYYFSSATGTSTGSIKFGLTMLMPNTALKVVIPNVQGGSKQTSLGTNILTTDNVGGAGQADVRDSDGILVGDNAEVSFTTGAAGANDHNFDFGFSLVMLCDISNLTANPSACNPSNNQYTLSGTVTFTNPPVTGTLTVQITGGGNQIFNAPFTSPLNYSIIGQNSDGAFHTVKATFSIEPTCNMSKTYFSPIECLAIPDANCSTITQPGCGLSNGSVTVNASNGTPPYSYLWSSVPAQSTQTATGLAAGSYTVTVTDNNGQTATCDVTLVNPGAPNASCSNTSPGCNLSTGTATANPTGGSAPYNYLWSDGQTTQTATNLAAGTFMVTITDNNGCSATCSTTLIEPGTPTITCSKTQPSCDLPNGGNISVNHNTGVAPYTYMWSNGQTDQTADGLSQGTYTVTVTDSNNCTTTCTSTLTLPIGCCQITATAIQPPDCYDNGTMTVNTDDRIKFSLVVNNTGANEAYKVSVNKGTISPITGSYGDTIAFMMQPGSAGQGDVIVTITDSYSPTCDNQVIIIDPKTCSPASVCVLDSPGLTNVKCNDNGTPTSGVDDYISFTLNPTGIGNLQGYTVELFNTGYSVVPLSGLYGTPKTFTVKTGSASLNKIMMRVRDTINPDCYLDFDVISPGTCSNCTNPPCAPINVIKN